MSNRLGASIEALKEAGLVSDGRPGILYYKCPRCRRCDIRIHRGLLGCRLVDLLYSYLNDGLSCRCRKLLSKDQVSALANHTFLQSATLENFMEWYVETHVLSIIDQVSLYVRRFRIC